MSTRASIKFMDGDDVLYLDRSHDGFPNIVSLDIANTIATVRNKWDGSEMGQLIAHFMSMHNDPKHRIKHYEPSIGPAGDESYQYWVKWDYKKDEWLHGVE